MIVHGASLPGGTPPGQDRWIATERSVIVLDGASAFDRDAPPADAYVDALFAALTERIDSPEPIPAVLARAIGCAAREVNAERGAGPSSTVAILREDDDWTEAAILGDSTIMLGLADGGTHRLTDDRMGDVASTERQQYRDRLRAGEGYDEHHRTMLRAIQTAERAARNQEAGYWIAEADPRAAEHASIRRFARADVGWFVLATDGAQRAFDHLDVKWATLPTASTEDLRALLAEVHHWEAEADPSGVRLPRAKRHDDKTVVTGAIR